MGAAIGAWLRWGLSLWLNPVFPAIPFGTLAANLGGGYLVGLAVAFFAQHPGLPPEWRLLIITGFLGGLTTFSTFSAELFTLLTR
ncbi:MAG: fluoride efflux transporter CrcB, partial [Gallionellaceae bacterium]|nr:fluoride efflux transporter CrcB [Gallionellaceae bacterium]